MILKKRLLTIIQNETSIQYLIEFLQTEKQKLPIDEKVMYNSYIQFLRLLSNDHFYALKHTQLFEDFYNEILFLFMHAHNLKPGKQYALLIRLLKTQLNVRYKIRKLS